MAWKQVKSFSLAKMGKKAGMCLQNVRLSFGINTGKYASAVKAMEADKKAGVFHAGTPPTDISVPVYCDTASQYEHVIVWDKGTCYTDGVKTTIKNFKVFGWTERADGRAVVEPKSEPKSSFLPAKGYWCLGDNDPRVGKLADFMYKTFPKYTSSHARGNLYGQYLKKSIVQFQKNVKLKADGMTGPQTYEALKKYGFKG